MAAETLVESASFDMPRIVSCDRTPIFLDVILMRYDPDPTLQHFLLVGDNPETDGLKVVHDDHCPAASSRDAAGYGVTHHECAVDFEIFNEGVDTYFRHQDAGQDGPPEVGVVVLAPGCYPIEAWSERRVSEGGALVSWEGGLRVVEAGHVVSDLAEGDM